MGDAAPRRHPVDLAGTNDLLDAQAVAMRDPSLEQVADGRESDVGMRPDIRVAKLVGRQVQGAGMIEEDERPDHARSEEHTSELQSLMRISYAVFCLKKKKNQANITR